MPVHLSASLATLFCMLVIPLGEDMHLCACMESCVREVTRVRSNQLFYAVCF